MTATVRACAPRPVLRRLALRAVARRVEGQSRLLSERARAARPASEQTLIDELNRTFASPDYQPPLLPAAALELLTLARDPNVSFGKIVALLESEPLIAARVLRIAQSPFYSGGARVQTIDDAVMRLGIRTIALVFTEAATNAQVFSSEVFRAPMQALRQHSMVTAHLARKLAERIGQPGDRIYVCGLLHDIGIAACLLIAPTLRGPDGRGFTFDQLKLPIYVLVDNDPWGLYIYSVLKQGSINLAYESMRMAVPNVRFLGMSSFDYKKFTLPKAVEIKLSKEDVARAEQMKAYPWFQDKKWQREIQELLRNGFKMEVDSLLTKSISFITEEYIPKKLRDRDFLS